jgi:branched-chain amino acid transport system permease protein
VINLSSTMESRPRLGRWLAAIVALMVLLGAFGGGLLIPSRAILSTLTTLFMFMVLAQAWNILGGYGGYLNLGIGAFFGVGVYTLAILERSFEIPLALGVVAAAMVAALFALIIGPPTLRVRGVYFAIITLILAFLMQRLAFNLPFTQGAVGIFLSPLTSNADQTARIFYFVFLGMAVVTTVAVRTMERHRFGFALVAIREDEDAADNLGVKTTSVKVTSFVIGAVLAGVCGALFAKWITFIDPDAAFPLNTSVDPVLMAFFGGAGTWLGPVLGAPLVVLLGEVLRVSFGGLGIFGRTGIPAEVARLVFGVILMVVALWARRGLMGLVRRRSGSRRRV